MALIENKSILYAFARAYSKPILSGFFDKVIINGENNLVKGKPVILTPNHQNALIDPMLFSLWTNSHPIWLARGDLFNSVTTPLFRMLKLLPVYRSRDGSKSLGKNDEIFDITSRILKKNKTLALFPEAAHTGRRRLLSIKKGVPRIVFKTLEETDFDLDIHIQPAGVYYEHYYNYKHNVIINFGEPIPVSKYISLYKESKFKANQELQKDLGDAIKKLALHIPSEENYDMYNEMRVIARVVIGEKISVDYTKPETALNIDREFANKLWTYEETTEIGRKLEFEQLKTSHNEYNDLLKKNKLRDDNIIIDEKKKRSFFFPIIALILSFPFFLAGFITHIIPFKLPDYIIKKKIKDPQFYASINFLLSLLTIPLNYAFWAVLLFSILKGLPLVLAVVLLLVSGDIAFAWYCYFKRIKALLKAEKLRKKGCDIFQKKEKLVKKIEKMVFAK